MLKKVGQKKSTNKEQNIRNIEDYYNKTEIRNFYKEIKNDNRIYKKCALKRQKMKLNRREKNEKGREKT